MASNSPSFLEAILSTKAELPKSKNEVRFEKVKQLLQSFNKKELCFGRFAIPHQDLLWRQIAKHDEFGQQILLKMSK